MTISEMWDTIVEEYGIATWEELELITAINGYNEDALNDVIFVRTGYRNIEQLLEEEQEVNQWREVLLYQLALQLYILHCKLNYENLIGGSE